MKPVRFPCSIVLQVCAVLALNLIAAHAAGSAGDIRFNRDIRPLISDNCLSCHGPDSTARKASLRLDTRAGLFGETKSEGKVVVPGKPDKSALWQRITSKDEDELMPPPKSHKELKPAQRDLIKRWIQAGAKWEDHWAFIPPERPSMPKVKNTKWVSNPIDAFVLAKLEEKGLKPAPEADRRTLARRLSLDLIGLPPSPQEVEAFVNDKSPDAYERLVKRLMTSAHYGEHRGRYWLDVARYADTHGLHFDNYREMWPYRDWVIKAINRNLPFDQFTIEQLAGDLLENATDDQRIATGFQRCNITTNEGGTIDDENLANYANDRVSTTGWVWLGLTANCAACHDHKFDPISQKEFYSMAAFYRNTQQGPKDGNKKDSDPSVLVPQTEEDGRRWKVLPAEITAATNRIAQYRKDSQPAFEKWLASVKPDDVEKSISGKGLVVHVPINEGKSNQVSGVTSAAAQFTAAESPEWKPDGQIGPAAVLKSGATFDLGNLGDFEKDQPFSYGAWVWVPEAGRNEAILARMDQGNDFRGWDLFVNDRNFSVHLVHKWPTNGIKIITTGNLVRTKSWQHVFVTYDGSGKSTGLKIYVNGADAKTKTDNETLTGSIRTEVPLRVGQRSKDQLLVDGRVQDVRVYSRKLDAGEVKNIQLAGLARSYLLTTANNRSASQKTALLDFYLEHDDSTHQQLVATRLKLETEQADIRNRNPVTHIQAEKKDTMPMAYILFRGQYDQPKDKVEATVFAALNPLPAGAPKNRLGLAQWLVARDNPLTARVTVNRFWQEIFGTGLVKTTEDFGIMGEHPANEPLLDWLAVEFRDNGWDMKRMIELMVTSSAYRQSALTTPEKLAKDPANRLLSRGPRFRMDAEMVRDYALSASGLMSPKIGGASVKPYQPDGVWEAVAMPESNTRAYKRDTGEALYRRSLYTFWKRAAPPAMMDVFNAPSREVSCTRRERTNTPLQALATLNDPQFVEAARHLAESVWKTSGADADKALEIMGTRVLLRPFDRKELPVVQQTWKETLAYYEQKPDEAKKLITVGESKPDATVPAPQLAALTMVANQLLNLDEVLNK